MMRWETLWSRKSPTPSVKAPRNSFVVYLPVFDGEFSGASRVPSLCLAIALQRGNGAILRGGASGAGFRPHSAHPFVLPSVASSPLPLLIPSPFASYGLLRFEFSDGPEG